MPGSAGGLAGPQLREKAEGECDARAANTLIAALRRRGDEEWQSLAKEWVNSGASLYAARALLNVEVGKPVGERDTNAVFRWAATISALGANNTYGTLMSGDSYGFHLHDYGRDAAMHLLNAMDSANAGLQETEDQLMHSKQPYRFTNCSVVRAAEPPHPWNNGAFERFLKLHPEYPR